MLMRPQQPRDVSQQVVDVERFEDHVHALGDQVAFRIPSIQNAT